MDTRLDADQAELFETVRRLTADLGPKTVADLDDDDRRGRLDEALGSIGVRGLREREGGESLAGLPAWLASWLMLLGQSGFNFFVTSGSGQAALTMPIMAPLSDLIGVTRQIAVLAFQLGDGLTNLVVPTSAVLIACLGAAKMDWLTWVRAIAAFFLGLMALASLFVIGASLLGFS